MTDKYYLQCGNMILRIDDISKYGNRTDRYRSQDFNRTSMVTCQTVAGHSVVTGQISTGQCGYRSVSTGHSVEHDR